MLAATESGPTMAAYTTPARSRRPIRFPGPTVGAVRSTASSWRNRADGHVARSTAAVPSMQATPM